MRRILDQRLSAGRLRDGPLASTDALGLCGMFHVRHEGTILRVMGSTGEEWPFDLPAWEHVSVSTEDRCPSWDEMNFVKGLFWTDEETVLQFHPRGEEYVNIHNFVLHLWRIKGVNHELPPGGAI